MVVARSSSFRSAKDVNVEEDVDAVVDAALAPLAHSQLQCAPLACILHECASLAQRQFELH